MIRHTCLWLNATATAAAAAAADDEAQPTLYKILFTSKYDDKPKGTRQGGWNTSNSFQGSSTRLPTDVQTRASP